MLRALGWIDFKADREHECGLDLGSTNYIPALWPGLSGSRGGFGLAGLPGHSSWLAQWQPDSHSPWRFSMSIILTPFARTRLFPREPRPNTIRDITAEAFEAHLNAEPPLHVLPGYAPFCKLHVYRNWTTTRCLTVPITEDNRHLLRSSYEARNQDELPVLVRWFEGVEPPVAEYLIVILYSAAQLSKEGAPIEGEWGVVGCLYTMTPEEIPMAPITMMRNALGVEEGGSGVALQRDAYQRSVAYWQTHANWR